MKKTILNFAAIAVIATTSFIACDKKQATDAAAPAADSTQVDSTATTPEAPDTTQPAAAKVDSTAKAETDTKAEPNAKAETEAKAEEVKK